MQQTVFAVVAQAVNYRDHDRVLTLITRERGTVTATARGCRKPQSKLMSCAQPFVYGEYELADYKGRLYVKSCQVREIFYNLRLEPTALAAAGQAVQAARAFANPEEDNAKLFTLLLFTLARLCEKQADHLCCPNPGTKQERISLGARRSTWISFRCSRLRRLRRYIKFV